MKFKNSVCKSCEQMYARIPSFGPNTLKMELPDDGVYLILANGTLQIDKFQSYWWLIIWPKGYFRVSLASLVDFPGQQQHSLNR